MKQEFSQTMKSLVKRALTPLVRLADWHDGLQRSNQKYEPTGNFWHGSGPK